MTSIFLSILIAFAAILFFVFFVWKGIKYKDIKRIILAVVFLGMAISSMFWLGIIVTRKAYTTTKEAIHAVAGLKDSFKPRDGKQIYKALFGAPVDSCINILHYKDQLVPLADCCIWLQFKTCPVELKRIISQEKYEVNRYKAIDSISYMPSYGEKPEWWTPYKSCDEVTVMRKLSSNSGLREQVLVISKDSSIAYYCDMAE